MSFDEETSKQVKRLRDQIEGVSENLLSVGHRQDEFAAVNIDVRAELLRMDANQSEIIRVLSNVSAKLDKINRKLELVGSV